MRRRPGSFAPPLALLAVFGVLLGPIPSQTPQVVVYVAHDQEHSEALLRQFEAEWGIEVLSVFDTEDNKTVGLVNRLIDERTNPRADVFWNNEAGQTLRLQDLGLLAPYVSPNASDIPAAFKDAAGHWTGFGARARVLVYNTNLIQEADLPRRLEDLARPEFASRMAMAKPLTGTTLTHAAALYAVWGAARTDAFLDALRSGGVLWERGNGQVKRVVGEGARAFGLTDTDDVNVGRLEGLPIRSILLDQEEGGLGTLVIPNTVMMIKGAHNEDSARALIDFLLTPAVERSLAEGAAAQIPLHPGVPTPAHVLGLDRLRPMAVDFRAVGTEISERLPALVERFEGGTGSRRPLMFGLIALGCGAVFVVLAIRRGRRRP